MSVRSESAAMALHSLRNERWGDGKLERWWKGPLGAIDWVHVSAPYSLIISSVPNFFQRYQLLTLINFLQRSGRSMQITFSSNSIYLCIIQRRSKLNMATNRLNILRSFLFLFPFGIPLLFCKLNLCGSGNKIQPLVLALWFCI